MRAGIVAQPENDHAAYLAAEIAETLADRGVERWIDETTAAAIDAPGTPVDRLDACDLVVSIGGDGTFLFAARHAGPTPVLGVNLGEVGFLNAVSPTDAVASVEREVDRFESTGSVPARSIPRLAVSGGGCDLAPALNEVVVQGAQRGHGQGCSVEIRIDGSLYTATRADGVLVATPTGSTAYNLSEGGPLVHPGADVTIVTAMASAEPARPLVVDDDSEVTVRVDDAPTTHVVADGTVDECAPPPTQLTVGHAEQPARVAGPPVNFFRALGKLE